MTGALHEVQLVAVKAVPRRQRQQDGEDLRADRDHTPVKRRDVRNIRVPVRLGRGSSQHVHGGHPLPPAPPATSPPVPFSPLNPTAQLPGVPPLPLPPSKGSDVSPSTHSTQ